MLHLTIPAGIDLAEARRREQMAWEGTLRPVRRCRADHPLRRILRWAGERMSQIRTPAVPRLPEERNVLPFPRPSHAER
jgi:hypothetical protein